MQRKGNFLINQTDFQFLQSHISQKTCGVCAYFQLSTVMTVIVWRNRRNKSSFFWDSKHSEDLEQLENIVTIYNQNFRITLKSMTVMTVDSWNIGRTLSLNLNTELLYIYNEICLHWVRKRFWSEFGVVGSSFTLSTVITVINLWICWKYIFCTRINIFLSKKWSECFWGAWVGDALCFFFSEAQSG